MTLDEYVESLQPQVDPEFVEQVKHWPVDTKLYVYLHHIQLAHMAEYKKLLLDAKHEAIQTQQR